MRRFASIGWQEIVLPDGSSYYSNSTLHVVTDIDLRNSERLDAVTTFLEGRDMDILPPQGWELWLRDAGASTTTFIPAKAWVHHGTRMVLFDAPHRTLEKLYTKMLTVGRWLYILAECMS
jgi:hypothetical protein